MSKSIKNFIIVILAFVLVFTFLPSLRNSFSELNEEKTTEEDSSSETTNESTAVEDSSEDNSAIDEESSVAEESSEEETTDSSTTERVPGLYEAGSNYGTLLMSWDELVDSGSVVISNQRMSIARTTAEKNEYGFYYGAFYSDNTGMSLVFYADTSFDLYFDGELSESIPAGIISYSVEGIDISFNGLGIGVPSEDGSSIVFNSSDVEFVLDTIPTVSVQLPGDLMISSDGSVTGIDDNAFSDCAQITGIRIPVAVTSIGDGAFEHCVALESIVYEGTVEQVSAIVDGSDLFAKTSVNVISCSDGECFVGLISDSWEEIISHVNDGTYATRYCVGAYKPLDLGSEGIINMQVAAIDADVLSDGTGNAHITWLAKELLATSQVMNSSATNANGWAACDMRKYLQEDIWALISRSVQNGIVAVDKTYYDATTGSTLICSDTLWIPSLREISASDSYEDSGITYQTYNENVSTFWTRTASERSSTDFMRGDGGGTTSANVDAGVLLGFCF